MEVPRQTMFEAEMLHQQLQHIQENLAKLEKQMEEVLSMKDALDQFAKIEAGQELLVPLAAGVFARATATDDKTLRVNVGNGVVVPKSVAQVHEMLDEQLAEMRKYETEMHAQFDKALARLQELEKQLGTE